MGRIICMVLAATLLFSLIRPQPALSTPLFSSKAMGVATNCRKVLEGYPKQYNSKQLKSAVESLESLLTTASFRRLDIQDRTSIILLLSQVYATLGRWPDQEALLASYSKKREFHNQYIPLSLALARAYIAQDKFVQSEKLLDNIIGKSCRRLAQDEKQQLASVVLSHNAKLLGLVKKADSLRTSGQYAASIPIYEQAVAALQGSVFPYQISPVERERFLMRLRLALCEAQIIAGRAQEARPFLDNPRMWPLYLFNGEKKRKAYRQYLNIYFLSSLQSSLGESGAPFYFNDFFDKEERGASVLWQQLFGAMNGLEPLQDGPGIEFVQLLHSAQFGNASMSARRLLAPDSGCPEELVQLISLSVTDMIWDEALLYKTVGLHDAANRTMARLSLFQNEKAKAALNFWRAGGGMRHSEGEEIFLKARLFELQYPPLFSKAPSMRSVAIRAISDSQALLSGKIPLCGKERGSDQLLFQLFSIGSALGDPEGKSLFLHMAADIFISQQQYGEALALFQEVCDICPQYEGLARFGLHFISAMPPSADSHKDVRAQILPAIFRQRELNEFHYMSLAGDELAGEFCLQQNIASQDDLFPLFLYATRSWREAKKSYDEAERSKDPGGMKIKYEEAFSLYREASLAMDQVVRINESNMGARRHSLFEKTLLTIDREWLLKMYAAFHRYEAAYNELGSALSLASDTVERRYSSRCFPDDPALERRRRELNEAASSAPIYAATFARQFDQAIGLVQGMSLEMRNNPTVTRAQLFLCHALRENGVYEEEEPLLLYLDELQFRESEHELALMIAFEKALFFRDILDFDRAMVYLSWIINDAYASSLRVRSMLIRAEIYGSMNRKDLAKRQLEAIAGKGGDWASVAERKLEDLKCRS